MNLYILAEPAFYDSSWYLDILRGMRSAKNARNHALCYIDPTEEDAARVAADGGVLLLPGSSHAWCTTALSFAFSHGLYPIVIGTLTDEFAPPHCLITQDYVQNAMGLCRALREEGCERIAFFGHNPDSDSDGAKLRGALLCDPEMRGRVFENRGDIAAACTQFSARMREFDAVIFANDYAGVALLRALEQCADVPAFKLACFGAGILLREKCPSMRFAALDFAEAGKKAAEFYPFLCKNRGTLSVKLTIRSKIGAAASVAPETAEEYEGAFYADPIIRQIMHLERVLEHSDATDRALLASLSKGDTLEETADSCHMSISGIKYRLSRLKAIGDYPHTADLLAALQKWK